MLLRFPSFGLEFCSLGLAKSGNSNSFICLQCPDSVALVSFLFYFGFVFVVLDLKKILYSCLVGMGERESTCVYLIQKWPMRCFLLSRIILNGWILTYWCVLIHHSYYFYWCSDAPYLISESLFELASESFWPTYLVFGSFLAFWCNKMFQAHLVSSLPQTQNQHFSKLSFLLLKNGI